MLHALTDAVKAETLRANVGNGHPLKGGHIVVGRRQLAFVGMALVKHVECGNVEAAEMVNVGQREEKTWLADGQSGFFHHFAANALLRGFSDVGKTAWQVERTLSGLASADGYEQLVAAVADKSHAGGRGIEKPFEAALLAAFALERADYEVA